MSIFELEEIEQFEKADNVMDIGNLLCKWATHKYIYCDNELIKEDLLKFARYIDFIIKSDEYNILIKEIRERDIIDKWLDEFYDCCEQMD